MNSLRSLHLLLAPAVVILICISNACGAPAPSPVPTIPSLPREITFYQHTNFTGSEMKFTVDTQNCYLFAGKQDFSSVKIPTGTCMKLYPTTSCYGTSVTLQSDTHSFMNLRIDINDKVTSFRRCRTDEVVQTIPVTTAASLST